MIYPVILTGGSGSRLWPLSRTTLPKQLLSLIGDRSMLQQTMLRIQDLPDTAAPVVICSHEHRFLIAEQLREIELTPQALILEPVGRNTAPAAAVAASYVASLDPDALILVLPSDHVITNVEAFHAAVRHATPAARQGRLVTFGVVANSPETGYGYIQCGEQCDDLAAEGESVERSQSVRAVSRFVEKPDRATAEEYVASGEYLWNSGMFLFRVSSLLEEMEKYMPDSLAHCRASLEHAYADLDFYRLEETAFRSCESQSIDYAVMEKTGRAAVVPLDAGWSDIGSWKALWELHEKDHSGNVARGEVMLEDVNNSYINAQKRLVAVVGLDDLIVVETTDAVLISHKDKSQQVRHIVDRLQKEGRTEHIVHSRNYRPWGSYEGVDRGERFQVKRIVVEPGAQLSLQMHHHRSEHWVVVSGTAQVTVGDSVRLIGENESVYIPLGAQHRLQNPGRIPLHLIEVQSGSYLGEDDIVRVEDIYGRVEPEAGMNGKTG